MKPPLTIYRLRLIDCDGGYLGKTWKERFYSNRKDAENSLDDFVQIRNKQELNRGRMHACYVKGSVEEIAGWLNHQYRLFATLDVVTVDSKNAAPFT